MSAPKVTSVVAGSAAELAGLRVGDELVSLNGEQPSDVIEYQQLVDGANLEILVKRSGSVPTKVRVHKAEGEPLGLQVSAAVFDRVRTCDNHCAFCFIYQLPKGMRRSLYLKDDDYRLSFLYGNFTTLTRFTELDAERVITERLGPVFVSIHATDPQVRAAMLRNPRGATSLRWLRVLLEAGIEVHGQLVICPGVNDGEVLERTLVDILDRYPALASVGIVPLGLSRFSSEPDMRPHSKHEAARVLEAVIEHQGLFKETLGRRMVFASDEYYLMVGEPFPSHESYEGYPQHENGIGMVSAFRRAFRGDTRAAYGARPGFFAWVEGAPATGYRSPRAATTSLYRSDAPTAVLTGSFGADVLRPLVEPLGARVIAVENQFFGGTIAVAGLMCGTDVAGVLAKEPPDHRYLLPDACLSNGVFLDGVSLADLPRPVEVVATDGLSLRRALEPSGQ
ncbi:MAG: DUF512 domain-containing protein [Acidimicrobiales bacterium]